MASTPSVSADATFCGDVEMWGPGSADDGEEVCSGSTRWSNRRVTVTVASRFRCAVPAYKRNSHLSQPPAQSAPCEPWELEPANRISSLPLIDTYTSDSDPSAVAQVTVVVPGSE